MKENEEVVNVNFFKKMWYSITKFEQYPAMATEGLARATKYLIALTAIVTAFLTIGSMLEMNKMMGDLADYINQNIPEFSYAEEKLSMDIQEPIIIEEIQYEGIDKIAINTLIETEEEKEQFEKENSIVGTTVFLFDNQIVLQNKTENNEVVRQPFTYNDFIASYTGENIEKFNKAQLIEYMTSEKMISFYGRYALSLFISLLIVNIMVAIIDSLEIALLGWITTMFARIKMRFVAIYNMAVYSLTLPILLNVLYIIANYFTDFTISYFQVAYITIAYIYLTAAIFIIKDDFIKRMQEVKNIQQEQQKVKQEIEEREQKKEEQQETDKKDEKKEDEKQGEEPQGSEA